VIIGARGGRPAEGPRRRQEVTTMRRLVHVALLGGLLLCCGGYSSCEYKEGATGMLLSYGGMFRKDPVTETTLFSRDFPGIPNPYVDDVNTEWRVYARRSVQLGNLWSHQLNFLQLQVYDDGPSGLTPTVVAQQFVTLPDDGLVRLNLLTILAGAGFTSPTPTDFRVRVAGGGMLALGSRKDLKNARKAFLKGLEPYPSGVGSLSALAMTTTVFSATGKILSQWWTDFPVFAENAT
jgi:hypothetical protein